MRLQVITHNVGGLYTDELLDAASYAGPSAAGKGASVFRGAAGPRRLCAACGGPDWGPTDWGPQAARGCTPLTCWRGGRQGPCRAMVRPHPLRH